MADINVQIKQRNGAIWDNLYPKTKASLVETNVTQQFVSKEDKDSWSGKQDDLGFTPENVANRGIANGYAPLDEDGHVSAQFLPSYVDDVIEGVDKASFPVPGETGKIYVALDTNLAYRWSGSTYIEVSPSIALGVTSATAYRGDRGKIAYDHSQSDHAPADAQKNSDITKAEIEAKLTGVISSHSHEGSAPTAHASSHISTGSDPIPTATTAVSGLMSKEDKIKLDSIGEGANKLSITTSATEPSSPTNGDWWYAIV